MSILGIYLLIPLLIDFYWELKKEEDLDFRETKNCVFFSLTIYKEEWWFFFSLPTLLSFIRWSLNPFLKYNFLVRILPKVSIFGLPQEFCFMDTSLLKYLWPK